MNLKEKKQSFHSALDAIYGENEVSQFFYMLTEAYLGLTRLDIAMQPDSVLTETQNEHFDKALKGLKQNTPIQYLLGGAEFLGLPFKVNENVLIPRSETEELVLWIVENQLNVKTEALTILDIGTGSGCIAISLAKKIPHAKVYALDVSKQALQVAKNNALLNEVEVAFVEANILNPDSWSEALNALKFDIIVSNPPYVRELEKKEMKANVLDNEPHLALFVEDDNPLQFYKAIVNFAKTNLKDNGQLYFEINESLGEEMQELLKQNEFKDIQLKQDVFKKDRMIKGVKSLL